MLLLMPNNPSGNEIKSLTAIVITPPPPSHGNINLLVHTGILTRDSQHGALVNVPYGIVCARHTSFNPNHG